MFLTASRALILAVAALAITGSASAQTTPPPHVPLQKTIGVAKPEVVPSLFVLSSRGAVLQGGKLLLTGVSPNAIIFADRTVRAAGHDLTSRIVEDWGSGSDNFSKDPPNATVSVFQREGNGVRDAVIALKNPELEGENLAFDVDVLEGDIKGVDGAASLFIDIIGRPFTPMSFAGVAQRTAWRGATTQEAQQQLEPPPMAHTLMVHLAAATIRIRLVTERKLLL
ncbi:hypothetical protein SAMN05443247_08505 [Bradyrhizobium erythrophlei]|nr:hypothetical protein SAMN05443247_08505 [Bradyrhizobium erythrophlei]